MNAEKLDFPERSWLPDQLKGMAVLWMILIHSMELFLIPAQSGHPIARFAYFMGAVPAAPMFMILMGFFGARPGTPFFRILKRGFKLILWGLLLNLGLNFSLIVNWMLGKVEVNILQYILGVDILIFAGFALILLAFLSRMKLPWFLWLALSFIPPALSSAGFLSPDALISPDAVHWFHYLQAVLTGPASWSYFPLIPWLSYVIAGYGLYQLLLKYPDLASRSQYKLYLFLPAFVIFLVGLAPSWKTAVNLELYYNHGVLFYLWALAFLLLLTILVSNSRKWSGAFPFKWIRFLGVRVTSVYVIQWLIIGNTGTWIYQSCSLTITLLLFAVVLLLTSALSYIYFSFRFGKSGWKISPHHHEFS
jgi:uncharacterized membrane protein